jgi:hypothetical protein
MCRPPASAPRAVEGSAGSSETGLTLNREVMHEALNNEANKIAARAIRARSMFMNLAYAVELENLLYGREDCLLDFGSVFHLTHSLRLGVLCVSALK